jgi:hypothetical protein
VFKTDPHFPLVETGIFDVGGEAGGGVAGGCGAGGGLDDPHDPNPT